MKKILGVVVLALLSGCAGSFEEAKLAGAPYREARAALASGRLVGAAVTVLPQTPTGVNCVDVDRAHIFWDGAGKAFAAAAGTQGLILIPVESSTARELLAAGIATSAVLAVMSEAFASGMATEYMKYCGQ